MSLFKPGWDNKDKAKALEWVNKQSGNSPALMKAAAGSNEREIREAAARKITDQKKLIDLARAYCPEAVMAIDDPDILYTIAETTSFFIGKDCSIEYKILRAVDKNFSVYGEPWYISLDVPAGEERLRSIRETEKMFGLALLALKMLKERGSDQYFYKLIRNSMYDMVREQAAEEIIKRDPAAARAIVSDPSLRKHVRQKAFLQAEDPQLRSEYCGELDMHNWEQISQSSNTIGDHVYIKECYRCIYCGQTKSEEESRIL